MKQTSVHATVCVTRGYMLSCFLVTLADVVVPQRNIMIILRVDKHVLCFRSLSSSEMGFPVLEGGQFQAQYSAFDRMTACLVPWVTCSESARHIPAKAWSAVHFCHQEHVRIAGSMSAKRSDHNATVQDSSAVTPIQSGFFEIRIKCDAQKAFSDYCVAKVQLVALTRYPPLACLRTPQAFRL